MSGFGKISRRRFLGMLTWALALGAPWRAAPARTRVKTPDPLAWKLVGTFHNRHGARIVGLDYLRSAPEEANVNRLVDLICSFRAGWRQQLQHADGQLLRKLLSLQQQHDFEHGRVIVLHGWIFSETEVRLCGLAALCQAPTLR